MEQLKCARRVASELHEMRTALELLRRHHQLLEDDAMLLEERSMPALLEAMPRADADDSTVVPAEALVRAVAENEAAHTDGAQRPVRDELDERAVTSAA